ncbi:MAG: hypothetical protein M3016_09965 [Actinomycetota bacterium]|nr:hypothetical protein [Actinomycetota bacterium]
MTHALSGGWAKTATVAVTLVGLISVAAAFALSKTGVPAPKITAHPAKRTSRTTAVFGFVDARAAVHFVCSLNGSPYRTCISPARYSHPRSGRNVFRVRARTATGTLSPPRKYAWTVQAKLTVAFPLAGHVYGAASWRTGCGRGTGACGSAPSGERGASTMVSVQQNSTRRYWNGHRLGSRQAIYRRARLSGRSETGANWFSALPASLPDGAYTLRLRATVRRRRRVIKTVRATVRFAIDTTAPPVPTITAAPANPTSMTTAALSFVDAEPGVSYQCSLDSGSWLPCASPVHFPGLAVGTHTLGVRAIDLAGNASTPDTHGWRIISAVVSPSSAMPFSITGNATGLLYPGGPARAIVLTLVNPNSVAIYVTSVTTALQTTGLPAGCPASTYRLSPASIPSSGVLVPAQGSARLAGASVTAPTIQMLDSHTNQDSCRRASLSLSYTGSAHS